MSKPAARAVTTRAGRPRKASPPPGSARGCTSGIFGLVTAADLEQLAADAGLSIVALADALPEIAETIDAHFDDYALWELARVNNGRNAEKRDWAAGIAQPCRDLILALGDDDGFRRLDAKSHLDRAWPHGREDMARSHPLDRHLREALPEEWKRQWERDGQPDYHDLWWNSLDRLIPTLHALLMLSERTKAAWASEVQRGGSTREDDLRTLMARLATVYRAMFGALPTVSTLHVNAKRQHVPGGKSLDWHLGLLRIARAQCDAPAFPAVNGESVRRALDDGSTGPIITRRDYEEKYQLVADLADRALGLRQGRQTSGHDALAGWIVDGVAEYHRIEAARSAKAQTAISRIDSRWDGLGALPHVPATRR